MVAVQKQIEIGGLHSDVEEAVEIESAHQWRNALWSAIRTFVASYVDAQSGARGWDACAAALDRCWGVGPVPSDPVGRHVSGSLLRASLGNSNNNHFRAEWLYWFAAQDKDVADLLARRARPAKTADERLDDLEAELREELSHKRAEAVLRRARLR